jgi:citrate lyase gamma subunit
VANQFGQNIRRIIREDVLRINVTDFLHIHGMVKGSADVATFVESQCQRPQAACEAEREAAG